MKKKLTAWFVAVAMLCSVMPMAFATEEPDVEVQTGGVPSVTSLSSLSDENIKLITEDQIPEGAEVLEVEVVASTLNQQQYAAAINNPDEIIETNQQIYGQESIDTDVDTKAEYTTKYFSSYGEQLPNLVYSVGGTYIRVGSALKTMYNNYLNDVKKGTNSTIFKYATGPSGSTTYTNAAKKLGISVNFPSGLSLEIRQALARDMQITVYRCLDYDCSEMFFSNGYVGFGLPGSTTGSVTLWIMPICTKGFETLSQRTTLKNQLDSRVASIVKQAEAYPRAYDKIKFFHDWLCKNNYYNDAAAANSSYSTTISGAPWSSVGGLLSDVTGIQPVCEAYSRALQTLCHAAGITATVVTSDQGNHMWSNIRYGQYWTGVDVTWDDTDNGYNYNYFFKKVNNCDYYHVVDHEYLVSWVEFPELSVISNWKVLPFYDVADNFWGKPYIQEVYENNYMSGMTCVMFGINTPVTRAQFAQILYSIAGKPSVSYSNRFSDVPSGQWFTNAVLWANSKGIANGVTSTRFGVNDPITREQMALMLYKYKGSPSVSGNYISGFVDAGSVSEWARTAINWAVRDKIMSGTNKNELLPGGKATRTETAVMVSKIA